MILSRRYLMFAFYESQNLYYLYSPRYINWELREKEITLNPKIIRLGQTWYKRPNIGFSYEIEGIAYQKSFYELFRKNWYKIWGGVFVRLYLTIPVGSGSARVSGYYNFYILTGYKNLWQGGQPQSQ